MKSVPLSEPPSLLRPLPAKKLDLKAGELLVYPGDASHLCGGIPCYLPSEARSKEYIITLSGVREKSTCLTPIAAAKKPLSEHIKQPLLEKILRENRTHFYNVTCPTYRRLTEQLLLEELAAIQLAFNKKNPPSTLLTPEDRECLIKNRLCALGAMFMQFGKHMVPVGSYCARSESYIITNIPSSTIIEHDYHFGMTGQRREAN